MAQASAEDNTREEQLIRQDRNTLMKKARIKQLYKEKKLAEAYAVFVTSPYTDAELKNKTTENMNSSKLTSSVAVIPQLVFMGKSLIEAQDFVLKQREQGKYRTKHVFMNNEIPEEVFDEDEVMKAFRRIKYPLVATTTTTAGS